MTHRGWGCVSMGEYVSVGESMSEIAGGDCVRECKSDGEREYDLVHLDTGTKAGDGMFRSSMLFASLPDVVVAETGAMAARPK